MNHLAFALLALAAVPAAEAPPPGPETEPREGQDGIWRQRIRRYSPGGWYVGEIDEPSRERLDQTIADVREADAAAELADMAAAAPRRHDERITAELQRRAWDASEPERAAAAEARLREHNPRVWQDMQATRWNNRKQGRRPNIGGKIGGGK